MDEDGIGGVLKSFNFIFGKFSCAGSLISLTVLGNEKFYFREIFMFQISDLSDTIQRGKNNLIFEKFLCSESF